MGQHQRKVEGKSCSNANLSVLLLVVKELTFFCKSFRFCLHLAGLGESSRSVDHPHGDPLCPLLELLRDQAQEAHQEAERHLGPLGQGEPAPGPWGLEELTTRWNHLLWRDSTQVKKIINICLSPSARKLFNCYPYPLTSHLQKYFFST